jgi:hypothetical protein
MLKKIYIPTFIILLALSACEQGVLVTSTPSISSTQILSSTPTLSSAPTLSSGIEGYVTEGPMCPGPVRIGATNCQDRPYQATMTVLDANNNQINQFQTDINGYFKISLAPGTYILHPESGKPFPHAAEQSVEVANGQFTQVTVLYDTGMR